MVHGYMVRNRSGVDGSEDGLCRPCGGALSDDVLSLTLCLTQGLPIPKSPKLLHSCARSADGRLTRGYGCTWLPEWLVGPSHVGFWRL